MNQKLILLGENLADIVHFFRFIELKLFSNKFQMIYAIEGFSDTDHCLRHCNLRICVNFIVNIIHILGSINYNVLAILDKCISC